MLRTLLPPRQSFVMVKGAARLLPAEEPPPAEPPPAEPPPAEPPSQAPGQQEQHLHLMMQLLRPQDAIRLVGHESRLLQHGDGMGTGKETDGDRNGGRMGMGYGWGQGGTGVTGWDGTGWAGLRMGMGWNEGGEGGDRMGRAWRHDRMGWE